jgi:hypothetical protein
MSRPCPVCNEEAEATSFQHLSITEFHCGKCGQYKIGNELALGIPDQVQDWATTTRFQLSAALRWHSDRGTQAELTDIDKVRACLATVRS